MTDTLYKVCRRANKLYTFFLFSDLLVYGGGGQADKTFRKQKVIRLENVSVVSMADEDGMKSEEKEVNRE